MVGSHRVLFPQNTTFLVRYFTLQVNHSYSVEFEPPADNYLNRDPAPILPRLVFSVLTDYLQACRGFLQRDGHAEQWLCSCHS